MGLTTNKTQIRNTTLIVSGARSSKKFVFKGVWRNGSLVITSILFVKSKVRPECNALLRYDSYNHCEKYPKLATKSPREEKSLQESLGDSKRLLATFFKVPEI